MYIETPTEGYHFGAKGLESISEHYKATYLGYFQKKFSDGRGGYQYTPIDVWYQPNPNKELGHSHYFGMYMVHSTGQAMITDAVSCFEEPFDGMLCDDGEEVIISRYQHDYIAKKGAMIDGGRAYTRSSLGTRVTCQMMDGEWKFYPEVPKELKPWGPLVDLSAEQQAEIDEMARQLEIEKEFLDPANRAWEYDAAGVRVYKGTRTPYEGDMT